MTRSLRSPLLGGLVGGALVAVILVLVGGTGGGSTTTVVRQSPLDASRPVSDQSAGLTARQIYHQDAAGVVQIRSQIVQQQQSPFGFGLPNQQQAQATGSGFLVDRSGDILTNAHVVDGASNITVQFENHQTKQAKVLGKDDSSDLALLKVDTGGVGLDPLPLGDSNSAQVGDPVVAIGNPFGLDRTLTTGVVSALQRAIQAPNNFSIANVIQTDAAINPGNSGGPLLDAAGRVIGITSQIKTGGSSSGGNVGIGFAVPINTAKQIIPQLKKNGSVQHAFLGVTGADIDSSLQGLNLPSSTGVLVQTVTPNGPAAKAGLRGGSTQVDIGGQPLMLGGDVIVKLDGKPVGTMDDLSSTIAGHKPGDSVSLDILRGRQTKTIQATLGNRPATAAH